MRRRRAATTTKAAVATRGMATVAVACALLSSCGDDLESGSTEVETVVPTEVRAGAVEVVVPAGAATGGTLEVQEGTEPVNVPDGVVPLGPTTRVSLSDGTLDGAMQVSFEAPAALTPDQVPIVMAQDEDGGWRWLPTAWDDEQRVTAELTEPGQLFLARFDREPWLEETGADFADKASNPSQAKAPTCGDEEAAVESGLQVKGEPGDLLLWCAGVDTIESNPSVSGEDTDYAVEGVQALVLRVTNSSRLFKEVGYPEGWAPVDGSGRGLPGQELRERLGLAGSTREGLATRVLPPGETLTLLLPGAGAEAAGTVTADLSAAAWTLSALDFATSTYARLVAGVDQELGDAAWAGREELLAAVAGPKGSTPGDGSSSGEEPGISESASQELRECLAPVSEVILMNRDAAQQLVEEAFGCVPSLLRPALGEEYGVGAATMADGVAANVLAGLPATLQSVDKPWAQVSDAMTDPEAGVQIWVGPPAPKDFDYGDAPHVLRPGDEPTVEEWSPEFETFVGGRLDQILENNEAEPDASGIAPCPEGSLTVTRYRTDGFARASLVSCAGEPWTLVLGRTADGWREIDAIQQDPYFGCSVMGTYSVPAFIAGDMCLDGEQPQEYTE